MSQRTVRCRHCGLAHPAETVLCPTLRLPLQPVYGGSTPVYPPAPAPAPMPALPVLRAHDAADERDSVGSVSDGKYRFRTVLGEGGMGTVYEAESVAHGRLVAIKVLHPAQANKVVAVKRFHQEARAAGMIGHPNICDVYEVGALDDGLPYIVMERLTGRTLADRISREGGLPFVDVIDVVSQVASGLVAAHAKGIVHRDIKPENVFLSEAPGRPPMVKILDFGVSKMITPEAGDEELDLTRTGMVMGTPFYMSPEQARGDRNLDGRVDVWACGVILYEALTGRRPFVAANYNALLLQILTTVPVPVRELRPDLPAGFEPILDRAMARARERRYPSAILFHRDLATLRAQLVGAAPSPARRRTPTPPMGVLPLPRGASSGSPPRSSPPASRPPPSTDRDRSPPFAPRYTEDQRDPPAMQPLPHDVHAGEVMMTGFVGAAAPLTERAPPEIVPPDWDERTVLHRVGAGASPPSKPTPRAPSNLEDTVEVAIEGDFDGHVEHEADAEPDTRVFRPRRPS